MIGCIPFPKPYTNSQVQELNSGPSMVIITLQALPLEIMNMSTIIFVDALLYSLHDSVNNCAVVSLQVDLYGVASIAPWSLILNTVFLRLVALARLKSTVCPTIYS